MGEETNDIDLLLGNEHTPMKAIQRAAVVINDNTSEVVKNRHGALPRAGSMAAIAIRAAHARYKSAIGTDRESQAYDELKQVVAAIARIP